MAASARWSERTPLIFGSPDERSVPAVATCAIRGLRPGDTFYAGGDGLEAAQEQGFLTLDLATGGVVSPPEAEAAEPAPAEPEPRGEFGQAYPEEAAPLLSGDDAGPPPAEPVEVPEPASSPEAETDPQPVSEEAAEDPAPETEIEVPEPEAAEVESAPAKPKRPTVRKRTVTPKER